MSNFICEKCGAVCQDSALGYITGCEHYPVDARSNDGLGVTFPETRTVHWPSGPVNACDNHAVKLVGLLSFLGTHVVVTAAPANSQCTNCLNEATKG